MGRGYACLLSRFTFLLDSQLDGAERRKRDSRAIFILPNIAFGVGANLMHLYAHGNQTRLVCSSLEILVIVGFWVAIFKLNMEGDNPKLCWVRNSLGAFGVWATMVALRSFLY